MTHVETRFHPDELIMLNEYAERDEQKTPQAALRLALANQTKKLETPSLKCLEKLRKELKFVSQNGGLSAKKT